MIFQNSSLFKIASFLLSAQAHPLNLPIQRRRTPPRKRPAPHTLSIPVVQRGIVDVQFLPMTAARVHDNPATA